MNRQIEPAKVAPSTPGAPPLAFSGANLPLIFVLSDVYQRRSVHAVA
jgi:hypothetical protein